MYKNILVPVDLEHGDTCAHLLRLARHIGGPEAKVTLLNVMDTLPAFIASQIARETILSHEAAVRGELDALAAAVDPGAGAEVRQGNAAATILDAALAMQADAIVLGSHRPGYRDVLLGSTAARVVRHAKCSVVVDRSST